MRGRGRAPTPGGPPERASGPPAGRTSLTLGLVLGVTVMAFGGLAVVTIAPRLPAELGGLELYGWLFSGNLLAALLGTVAGGIAADRTGPGRPFALGLAAFALGSGLAALAPSMALVVLARVLQGAGSGAVITCIYVSLSLAYRDRDRPRLLAYLSSAWVVPALVGPALAGAVAELASWRLVFAALVPLATLVALFTLPTFLRLRTSTSAERGGQRLLHAGALALGVGAFLWALAGGAPWWGRLAVGLVALEVARRGLSALTPARTLRLGPGLGAVIAGRGLFFAAFISVEVFLALMLTDVHGLSSAMTGLVIAAGALSWSGGAWAQARFDARAGGASAELGAPRGGSLGRAAGLALRRDLRVRLGVSVLGLGILLQSASLALQGGPAVLGVPVALLVALIGWTLAGAGIGFAHATSSALALAGAEREGVPAGSVSSGLLLADNVASAVATGVGGALLAWATSAGAGLATGVALGFASGYLALALGAVAVWRISAPAPVAPGSSAPA